jgi:trimethylamine---corrinoid protein Co-methyltransferase
MARAGRRPRRERSTGFTQAPARHLRNPYPPFEILSADQIESIHQASLRVLAEIGVNFLLPEAADILKRAGAELDPDGTRVRFDPSFVEQRIRTAPSRFTLHARNPERNVEIGGNAINFCMVASTPHVSDLERGRLTGNFSDYCNLLKLGHSLNVCHMIAG